MKLRDTRFIVPAKAFPINPEIVRARAVTTELQLNMEKAHKLMHTARNLITVRRIMLEQIHWRKHRNLTIITTSVNSVVRSIYHVASRAPADDVPWSS